MPPQLQHIAILVPAITKSCKPPLPMKKEPAENNVYEIIAPFGMLRFIY